MRVLKKAVFVPVYFLACALNLSAGIAKKILSLVSGIFFLLMIAGMVITVMNHAWNQLLIFLVLMALGYGILFGIAVIKVLIEELKDFCIRKVF